jgi:uncharacterized protein
VRQLDEFTIPFRGMKDGTHDFEFKIDKKFFEYFEYSEIDNADLRVHLEMEKQSTLMVLSFELTGTIDTICDRCLDELTLPLEYSDQVVIKYGDEIPDSVYIGEESPVISHDDTEINVAQFIYEFFVLSIPSKRVHPDKKKGLKGCNPEMLKQLAEYSTYQEENEDSDPRWNELRKLLNDNIN